MTNKTIAGAFPLFFQIAPAAQAPRIAKVVEQDFLKAGGVVTTLVHSGQQWDAPNGWAPLQWMTIQGLRNYQQNALAENIAKRWIQVNTDVYARTGKMMEKYNVENTTLEAGGGEYPGQDGFGWTNGVLLKLISLYGKH
jgi:alpha,alpha-trehalase